MSDPREEQDRINLIAMQTAQEAIKNLMLENKRLQQVNYDLIHKIAQLNARISELDQLVAKGIGGDTRIKEPVNG